MTGAAPAEPPTVPRRLRRLPWAEVAGHRVRVAERPLPRLLGLALIDRGRAGSGLLIPRCRSVHTFGMRFALDLVFLDRGGSVISQRRGVRPGHVAVECHAASVLEIPS